MHFQNENEIEIAQKAVYEYRRRANDLKSPGDCATQETTGIAGRGLNEGEILERLFRYHPPTPETLPKYRALNQAAKNFAQVVLDACPPGKARSQAIDQIVQAKMIANAAIALDGLCL